MQSKQIKLLLKFLFLVNLFFFSGSYSLKDRKRLDNKKNASQKQCAICFEDEDFKGNGLLQETICHHSFHETCLVRWLSSHNDCPLCRGQLVEGKVDENNNAVFLQGRDVQVDYQTPLDNETGFIFGLAAELYQVVQGNDLDAVKIALERFPEALNQYNQGGSAPLHFAACNKTSGIIKYLLGQPGIKVNSKTRNGGNTPLHSAVMSNNVVAVALLAQDFRVKIHMRNKDQETPLALARRKGYSDIVTILTHECSRRRGLLS